MNRHARLIKLGLDTNPSVATRLINDYTQLFPCSLNYAHQLFDQVPHKDTTLYTSLISSYTRSNHPLQALQLFSLMTRQPDPTLKPNHYILATVARAVASSPRHLPIGQAVHARATKTGFLAANVVLGTTLLDMPDEFTVASVLVGCGRAKDLVFGMQIHGYAIVSGFEPVCVNPLGNMYFHCGDVYSAERVLDGMEGNVISILIKIRGHVFNQRYHDVIDYVASEHNIARIFEVDGTVFVPLLTACAENSFLNVGRQVHGLLFVTPNSLEDDGAIIGSALISMYCKCSSVGEARRVFDAWSTAQVALWNSMISGYMFTGLVENARELWEKMKEKNVISWTSMISGYVQNGMPQEGLGLLAQMYSNGDGFRVEGNCFTFVAGLEACSHITNLEKGKQIHAKLTRTLTKADIENVVLGTALVDMYSKSGHLSNAQTCFDLMTERNFVAWTSIIMGYACHGFGFRALEIFHQMMEMDIEPNEVTFVSVLTVCSHCSLVDKGLQYFKLMREKYRLIPREDHFTCLIDMLGRAGRLEEAWTLVDEIEEGETSRGCISASVWAALLGACQLHGNVDIGRRVAKKMLESKKQVSTTYVALSNVYAAAGMWNEAYRLNIDTPEDTELVEPLQEGCVWRQARGAAMEVSGVDRKEASLEKVGIAQQWYDELDNLPFSELESVWHSFSAI
ncbi:hypothetical protein Vadar_028038 [Vaccinium darrowii]|uniref:Uncharacterized protein n=1 Tax=Vaccinium darrowii TaxID=229202 RepID=A0ACB7ZFS7_9ERIC|nr:hypothetical protein Vadar_028038 [Vaccinium darrowii]